MADPVVRIVTFPTNKVKGVSLLLDDGSACIYLNSSLSREEQVKVYLHEMQHIERDDFYNSIPIVMAEMA